MKRFLEQRPPWFVGFFQRKLCDSNSSEFLYRLNLGQRNENIILQKFSYTIVIYNFSMHMKILMTTKSLQKFSLFFLWCNEISIDPDSRVFKSYRILHGMMFYLYIFPIPMFSNHANQINLNNFSGNYLRLFQTIWVFVRMTNLDYLRLSHTIISILNKGMTILRYFGISMKQIVQREFQGNTNMRYSCILAPRGIQDK